MEDKLYLPHEIKEFVKQMVFLDVGGIADGNDSGYKFDSVDERLAAIIGIYILAEDIIEHLDGKPEFFNEEEE